MSKGYFVALESESKHLENRNAEQIAKEKTKLIALADKLIHMSNGLSSEQREDVIAIAVEFYPLAQYVIESLKEQPRPVASC